MKGRKERRKRPAIRLSSIWNGSTLIRQFIWTRHRTMIYSSLSLVASISDRTVTHSHARYFYIYKKYDLIVLLHRYNRLVHILQISNGST